MKASLKNSQSLFHVTERKFLDDILAHGLLPGWGDWGLGIYFFSSITGARKYAAQGGWDHSLEDPVIVEVMTTEAIQESPNPEWPNPEKYLSIWYVPRKDDQEGVYWKPKKIRTVE